MPWSSSYLYRNPYSRIEHDGSAPHGAGWSLLTMGMVAMDKIPSDVGACCLPNVDGVTYLKVGSRGITIGMMNLDVVFKQSLSLGRRPDEITDEELLSSARRFNYVPAGPSVAADYAAALRRAYVAFCARQESKLGST